MEKPLTATDQERIVEFKKSLFGVNEKDVFDYIGMLKSNLSKAQEVFDGKLAELKSANELMSYERSSQEEKYAALVKNNQTLQQECSQLKSLVDRAADTEAELNALKEEHARMLEQIEVCKRVEEENQLLKKQIAQREIVAQMLEQQQGELTGQIEMLKRQNKEMLENFLNEKNCWETEEAEKRHRLIQQLEMHRFTLEQSRSTLNTLVSQYEETCGYLNQIHIE